MINDRKYTFFTKSTYRLSFKISFISLLHYFLLIIKNTLLQFYYYTSVQFDGEEQKAGALASVFFHFT